MKDAPTQYVTPQHSTCGLVVQWSDKYRQRLYPPGRIARPIQDFQFHVVHVARLRNTSRLGRKNAGLTCGRKLKAAHKPLINHCAVRTGIDDECGLNCRRARHASLVQLGTSGCAKPHIHIDEKTIAFRVQD